MTSARKFDPANWSRLLSPERRALLDPDALLDRLGIVPGSTVADVGAGPGFFTFPLAERVGPSGRVIALDVSPEMVALLTAQPRPRQLEVRQNDEARLPVESATVDLVLLAFVLHELADVPRFLAEVRRILAPAGRLAVLEWVPQDEPMGPPRHERLSEAESGRMLAAGGFTVTERAMPNGSNYLLVAR